MTIIPSAARDVMDKLNFGLNSMVQNAVYALPAARATLYTDAATPTLQTSNTSVFTANTAVTLTAGQGEPLGSFIRLTTAGPVNVTLKRA